MTIGQPERVTQNRVIDLFRYELGYRYLGDKTDLPNNSNIEEALLTAYLTKNDYTPAQISSAIYKLRIEADNPNRSLYDNNKEVYKLLRYGVPVKTDAGKVTDTVHLINWKEARTTISPLPRKSPCTAITSGVPIWCSMSMASQLVCWN